MQWCEEQPRVDYVLAPSTNSQLQRRAHDLITKAKDDYAKRLEPVSALMEQMFSPEEEVSEAEQLVPPAIWYRSHGT